MKAVAMSSSFLGRRRTQTPTSPPMMSPPEEEMQPSAEPIQAALRCIEDGLKRPSLPIDPSLSSPEEEVALSDTPWFKEARFFDLCLCPQRGADQRCL